MIPKVIHYCWFGGNPLPDSVLACMESWKKYCPDYEIKRWDESNYNVNACQYTQEAYAAKKWAFVSDYARFDILFQNGGVYLDTDVELIAPIDDIVEEGPFLADERNVANDLTIAPGLGMAAPKGLPFYGEMLSLYQKMSFIRDDGSYNQTTVVKHTTDRLRTYGLESAEKVQCVAGIWIYPWDYFCPKMYQTGELTITEHTRAIHHYDASWFTPEEQRCREFTLKMIDRFGFTVGSFLGRIYRYLLKIKQH